MPITDEQYNAKLNILVADPSPGIDSTPLCNLITGVYLSGLRRHEIAMLSWDEESSMSVVFSNGRPSIKIKANTDKSRKARFCPITPDFGEFLKSIKLENATGLDFPVDLPKGRISHYDTYGKFIAEVGKKTWPDPLEKFPSTHGFRRSLGTRWAMKVAPAILQKLMRHSDIKTTMKYYAHNDAGMVMDHLENIDSHVSSHNKI